MARLAGLSRLARVGGRGEAGPVPVPVLHAGRHAAREALELADAVAEEAVARLGQHVPHEAQGRHGFGLHAALAHLKLAHVLVVAAEHLVGAVAAQGHGDLLAGALAEDVHGQGRGVGKGLVEVVQHAVDVLVEVVVGERENRVVGFVALGHEVGVLGFVEEGLVFETDAERVEVRGVAGGQRGDDAGVDATAEEGAQRARRPRGGAARPRP